MGGLIMETKKNDNLLTFCRKMGLLDSGTTIDGENVPQTVTAVPEHVKRNYQALLSEEGNSLCMQNIEECVGSLSRRAWMAAIGTEWLSQRTKEIKTEAAKSTWDKALSGHIIMNGNDSIEKREKFMHEVIKTEHISDMREVIRNYLADAKAPSTKGNVEHVLVYCVCPWLFAYGEAKDKCNLCDKAFDMLEVSKSEDSYYTKIWGKIYSCSKGLDSFALRYFTTEYCNKKRCLECRMGYEFLKRKDAPAPQATAVNCTQTHLPHTAVQLTLEFT